MIASQNLKLAKLRTLGRKPERGSWGGVGEHPPVRIQWCQSTPTDLTDLLQPKRYNKYNLTGAQPPGSFTSIYASSPCALQLRRNFFTSRSGKWDGNFLFQIKTKKERGGRPASQMLDFAISLFWVHVRSTLTWVWSSYLISIRSFIPLLSWNSLSLDLVAPQLFLICNWWTRKSARHSSSCRISHQSMAAT